MNQILHQMNSATVPAAKGQPLTRRIKNYFNLLKNMSRLGFQLVYERKYGLRYFDGILNDEQKCAIYDDIIGCVMRPEEADSAYFQPEEIDAIAETLATDKMTIGRSTAYLRTLIASRVERAALETDQDGDTHVPTIDWLGEQAQPGHQLTT